MNYIYVGLIFLIIAGLIALTSAEFNLAPDDLTSNGCYMVKSPNACKGFFVEQDYRITNLKNNKVPSQASYQFCCPNGLAAGRAKIEMNILQIQDNLNLLNSEMGIKVESKGSSLKA